MTLKELKLTVCAIASTYKLKVIWYKYTKKRGTLGEYVPGEGQIYLAHGRRVKETLSTFFHELQHHISDLKGRRYYPEFGSGVDLAEEFYTDRLAALHMQKHFPKIKFHYGYSDKTVKDILTQEKIAKIEYAATGKFKGTNKYKCCLK